MDAIKMVKLAMAMGRRAGKSQLLADLVNIEEEIVQELSRSMAEEINFRFLGDILIADGWHKIEISIDNKNEVTQWVAECCQGRTKNHGNIWLFEDPKDVTLFTIRWL